MSDPRPRQQPPRRQSDYLDDPDVFISRASDTGPTILRQREVETRQRDDDDEVDDEESEERGDYERSGRRSTRRRTRYANNPPSPSPPPPPPRQSSWSSSWQRRRPARYDRYFVRADANPPPPPDEREWYRGPWRSYRRSRSRGRMGGSVEYVTTATAAAAAATSGALPGSARVAPTSVVWEENEDSDNSSSSADPNRDAYDFVLPRYSSSSQDATPSELSEIASVEAQIKARGSDVTQCVFDSRYTGSGSVGGNQTAELTLYLEQRTRPPLFRWIHFMDPAMDLDRFQSEALDVPHLTDVEKGAVSRLFSQVRRKYDKPLQTLKGPRVRTMTPGFLQETITPADWQKERFSKPQTISWVCLPYFCLAPYEDVSTLKAQQYQSGAAHPTRTLLQARFALVQKERDLQQAVCKLPDTPAGYCFHISQVWGIVLNDSLLLTCARLPKAILDGNAISTIRTITPGNSKSRDPRLLVSYGDAVLWAFRLEDCRTWFAFVSHFREFWPQQYRIMHNGRRITPERWPQIYNKAKLANYDLKFNFVLGAGYKPPMIRGILKGSTATPTPANEDPGTTMDSGKIRTHSPRRPRSISPAPAENLVDEGFHIFMCLSGTGPQEAKKPGTGVEQIQEDLKEMDKYLGRKIGLMDQSAYKDAPVAARSVSFALMESEKAAVDKLTGDDRKKQEKRLRNFTRRVDILNAADSIFQFFLPPTFEGPTVQKYWGAIHRILVSSSLDEQTIKMAQYIETDPPARLRENDLIEARNWLESIVGRIEPFKYSFSQAKPEDVPNGDIPLELIKAWLHILMPLVFFTIDQYKWDLMKNKGTSLLNEGMKKLYQGLNRKSLLENSVLLPLEVFSLINLQLLQDQTIGHSDISQTYTDYLRVVEANIEANPLDRSHQDKLTLLKQEILVVQDTIMQQAKVAKAMTASRQSLYARDKGAVFRSKPWAADGGGPGGVVVDEPQGRGYYNRDGDYYYSYPYSGTRLDPNTQSYPSRPPHYLAPPPRYEDIEVYNELPPSSASQLSPTGEGGYRELFAQESYEFLERRRQDFKEMMDKITDLERWNIQKIDLNRDRQESAIYAFTIVTVIFLPLSTVATILGMNTSDVRDMDKTQWIFWVVALPLTVLILFLSLVWTGELTNFWRGFANMWRPQKSSQRLLRATTGGGGGRSTATATTAGAVATPTTTTTDAPAATAPSAIGPAAGNGGARQPWYEEEYIVSGDAAVAAAPPPPGTAAVPVPILSADDARVAARLSQRQRRGNFFGPGVRLYPQGGRR